MPEKDSKGPAMVKQKSGVAKQEGRQNDKTRYWICDAVYALDFSK